MRTIKASEIGVYLYCQRAWWYQKQGVKSENISELARGNQMHAVHGRAVLVSGFLRLLAYGLLLLALLLGVAYLTNAVL